MNMLSFKLNLLDACNGTNLSYHEIWRITGISKQNIHDWNKKKRAPYRPLMSLLILCALLTKNPHWIALPLDELRKAFIATVLAKTKDNQRNLKVLTEQILLHVTTFDDPNENEV